MAALSLPPPSRLHRLGAITVVLLGVGVGVFLWKQPPRTELLDAQAQAAERGDTANPLISLRMGQVKELSVPELQRVTARKVGATHLVTWSHEDAEMQLYTLSVTAR